MTTWGAVVSVGSGTSARIGLDIQNADNGNPVRAVLRLQVTAGYFSTGYGSWSIGGSMADSGSISGTYGVGTYTLGYVDKTVERQYGSAYGGYNTASAVILGNSLSVGKVTWSVPALPYTAPSAPSNLKATRNSDSKATLTWTNHPSTAGPYSSLTMQRQKDGGSWATVASSVSKSATSWVDSTISAGHRYNYRIRANGPGGSSGWHRVDYQSDISTTPIAPKNVTATKNADGSITTAATYSGYTWGVAYDVADAPNGGDKSVLATGLTSLSYVHASPDNTKTHQYFWRAVAAEPGASSPDPTLTGPWSAGSGVVQLLAPPNPPLVVIGDGTGTLDRDEDITVSVTHQSVDTTAQTAAEVRWRLDGGDWASIWLTTETTASIAAPGTSGLLEVQARTKGAYSEYGAYSSTVSASLVARPTVALSTPTGTIETSRAAWEFTYYNADGSAQAAWQARLYQGSTLLETTTGTTETVGTFATALSDSTGYRITARVRAGNGLWSDTDETEFTTDFPPPAVAEVTAIWDRELGVNQISFTVDTSSIPLTVTRDASTGNLVYTA
jgi:hypothetical protein